MKPTTETEDRSMTTPQSLTEEQKAAQRLSPDVLGDQKDKGKATDYADSKESGSVTNEVIPVPTEEADNA